MWGGVGAKAAVMEEQNQNGAWEMILQGGGGLGTVWEFWLPSLWGL